MSLADRIALSLPLYYVLFNSRQRGICTLRALFQQFRNNVPSFNHIKYNISVKYYPGNLRIPHSMQGFLPMLKILGRASQPQTHDKAE